MAACGWQINTAFVERLNLDLRQHVAAIGRRVATLCKGEDGLRHQLALFQTSHNFCLPHASIRQPLPQPLPTNGTGSAKHVAPLYASDGRRVDRSCLESERGLAVSGAAVATASGGVSTPRGGKRHGEGACADDVRPHGLLRGRRQE